ncbi:hypothetical protein JT359_09310 [Candidatus Poribacteria bacterium]|nr:hypothetical protein [Candidatus Poribacteria bacterium]
MRLKDYHKEFVVKCYAKFMDRKDIVLAFIEEYKGDIEELCGKKYETKDEFMGRYILQDNTEYLSLKEKEKEAENMFPVIAEIINKYIIRLLSDRFRRLDINHPQFPNNYRELFNTTRDEFLNVKDVSYLDDTQDIIVELEFLYNIVKVNMLQLGELTNITLAYQILKTITATNLIKGEVGIIDITPEVTPSKSNNQNKITTTKENKVEKQNSDTKEDN